ncbi:MAG: NUDIX hydrolase [Desulfuromonas sp.]|nr:MAG: NUDIX hydrolase [Desulfuromonas sp.]
MPHPKHILVVSCLVRNRENAILCVKHKNRGWEMPQGRVEEGEALIDALHREVHEETGMTIADPRLAVIWSKLSEPAALIHGFVAAVGGGDLTPSDETPEVAWLSEPAARERITHPVNRDRLHDLLAAEGRDGGAVRFYSYTKRPYRRIDP